MWNSGSVEHNYGEYGYGRSTGFESERGGSKPPWQRSGSGTGGESEPAAWTREPQASTWPEQRQQPPWTDSRGSPQVVSNSQYNAREAYGDQPNWASQQSSMEPGWRDRRRDEESWDRSSRPARLEQPDHIGRSYPRPKGLDDQGWSNRPEEPHWTNRSAGPQDSSWTKEGVGPEDPGWANRHENSGWMGQPGRADMPSYMNRPRGSEDARWMKRSNDSPDRVNRSKFTDERDLMNLRDPQNSWRERGAVDPGWIRPLENRDVGWRDGDMSVPGMRAERKRTWEDVNSVWGRLTPGDNIILSKKARMYPPRLLDQPCPEPLMGPVVHTRKELDLRSKLIGKAGSNVGTNQLSHNQPEIKKFIDENNFPKDLAVLVVARKRKSKGGKFAFSEMHAEKLRQQLVERLKRFAESKVVDKPQPRYYNTALLDGRLVLYCVDQATVDWTLTWRPINVTKPAGRIRVILPSDPAHLADICFDIPGPPINKFLMLQRLRIQNPGLDTVSWVQVIGNRRAKINYFIFRVDGATLRFLQPRKWIIFHEITKIQVRIYNPQSGRKRK